MITFENNTRSHYNSRLKQFPHFAGCDGKGSEYFYFGCALAYTHGYDDYMFEIGATLASIGHPILDCQPGIRQAASVEMRQGIPSDRAALRKLLVASKYTAAEIYYRIGRNKIDLVSLTDPLNIHGTNGLFKVAPYEVMADAAKVMDAIVTVASLNIRLDPEQRRTPTLRELAFPLLCCWYGITGQRPGRWIAPPGDDRPVIGTAGGFIVDGLLAAGWNFTIDEIAAEYKPLRDKLGRLIRKAAS